MMKKMGFKPTFVKTKNVRAFEEMMDGLETSAGEGRLGLVWSRAGRGKTRTSQWWAAHHGAVYLRVVSVWRSSEAEFLRALCHELGMKTFPSRKGALFTEAVDRLLADPRPVFVDELEKMPKHFLDLVRDLSDLSTAAFVLIGEEEIVSYVQQNRRVWSRTFRQLEFEPIAPAEIVIYAAETVGFRLADAAIFYNFCHSKGNYRTGIPRRIQFSWQEFLAPFLRTACQLFWRNVAHEEDVLDTRPNLPC